MDSPPFGNPHSAHTDLSSAQRARFAIPPDAGSAVGFAFRSRIFWRGVHFSLALFAQTAYAWTMENTVTQTNKATLRAQRRREQEIDGQRMLVIAYGPGAGSSAPIAPETPEESAAADRRASERQNNRLLAALRGVNAVCEARS